MSKAVDKLVGLVDDSCETIGVAGVQVHVWEADDGSAVVQIESVSDTRRIPTPLRVNIDGRRVHGNAPPRLNARA